MGEMTMQRTKKSGMRSPNNDAAFKWLNQLEVGNKVLTSYPVSPYAKGCPIKELTIKQVVFHGDSNSIAGFQ